MLRYIVQLFVCLCAVTIAVAADAPVRAADLPRLFKGTYAWRDNGQEYPVELKLDRVEEKDGIVRFTGTNHYLRGDTRMQVRGEIDPVARTLKMTEHQPGGGYAAYAETEGAFAGKLSADLQVLEAEWTTRDTGRKGDLRLKSDGKP